MNFDFSDEQKQMRDEARKFLTEKCPPKAVRAVLDGKAPYDKELWKGLAELGLPQSWPPMGIEAMPISPLSGPIIGWGVGLALFGLTGWPAFSAAPPFALRIECMSKGYLAAKSDIIRADRGSHQAGFMQLAPLEPKTVAKGA